ncbi:MAG: Semialdehyde dehydrogenase, dimerization region [Bryobacterales bacterium]|nr:Semialdehyde dehydrogenase, dimerization region [Bryobacterales bacterium]
MAETIALVGSETLLGRELRDVLGQSSLGFDVRLVAAPDEEAGKITEAGGEPAVLVKLDRDAFAGAGAVLLACSQAVAREVGAMNLRAPVVDLTYGLEAATNARLRAPMIEPYDFRVPPDATQIVAHPAAIALAMVLGRIHPVFPIARAIVHVFEPASERGLAGIEEMQQQTVNLLSFKPLPKQVFDAQVSYNMLARFGEEAPVPLEQVEARIERHLTSLLANSGGAPVPSLRLIQSPVFHGYSFSLWIEFETNPGVTALEHVLNEPPIDLREAGTEPPNNVGVAGQDGVAVGAVTPDRNNSRAMWLWMVSDNLRLAAENALAVVKEVL